MKNTKTKLISSVTVLVICFAMLIGSTFAWFTDTKSTAVNKIEAGDLRVDLQDENGESLVDSNLSFKNSEGSTNILWEPGVTFETQQFQVVSTGNLSLKYKLKLNGVNVSDNALMKVIKLKVVDENENVVDLDTFEGHLTTDNSTSGLLKITATMDSNAGNEYKGQSYDGISITVYATQDTVEKDSKDNQYDKDATYDDEIVIVNNAQEFVAAMNNLEAGTIVSLGNDIDMSGESWSGVNKIGYTLEGNGHTIKNITNTTGTDGQSKVGGLSNSVGGGQALTVRNVTLENVNVTSVDNEGYSYAAAVAAYCDAAGAIILDNVNVIGANISSTKYAGGLLAVTGGYGVDTDGPVYCMTTISNCSVDGIISGLGSAGGAIAHCGWNKATKTTITNFTVTATVTGEDNAHTGAYIGTVGVGDLCEIDAVYYDGMIGRYTTNNANPNSKLICNGVEIDEFARS